jgi:malonate decarboxylase epsilon subunit
MPINLKTAFLFPGQGSQQAGMLHILPGQNSIVAKVFEEAESVLNKHVYTLDGMKELSSTVNVQLCLLIAGVISARRLLATGVTADFVAGHSVGAFGAAVISGVITFRQALALVHHRSRLMEEAFPQDYGMAALVGFTQSRLKPFLEAHNAQYPPVFLANINAADQLVLSGRTDSLKVLIEELSRAGIQKTKILNVTVPSHCELLASASAALKEQMESMQFCEPAIPYASNSTGRLLKTAEAIRKDLWLSLSVMVKWYDAITLIYESGARIFIEMNPPGVLEKIAASTFPDAKALSANESQIESFGLLWNHYQGNEKITKH